MGSWWFITHRSTEILMVDSPWIFYFLKPLNVKLYAECSFLLSLQCTARINPVGTWHLYNHPIFWGFKVCYSTICSGYFMSGINFNEVSRSSCVIRGSWAPNNHIFLLPLYVLQNLLYFSALMLAYLSLILPRDSLWVFMGLQDL